MHDISRQDPNYRYVTEWFWPSDRLARAVGISASDLNDLIEAGCGPGTIYAFSSRYGWWSALAGHVDGYEGSPPPEAERWFAPAAVWGFRRAVLARRRGASLEEAARQNAALFAEEFIEALERLPEARFGFADCFGPHGLVDTVARARAAEEWAAWIEGGYAVCLRIFTGETCVRKESLGAWLKAHIADSERHQLTAEAALSICEKLAQLMLPFAPWQRPHGTPGVTIDRLVADLGLGVELPFRGEDAVLR
ncbi:MAG: DUF6058 family natural product biosynthesis protein [Sphingomonas bacterium]